MWSKPCSRKSAASAASRSAASTFRFCASRSSSSAGIPLARSISRRPRPSSAPTTAQLARETTCERILARRPSEKSGKRPYSAWATASSSTLSPRNSRRSYDDARSGAHEECVKTGSSRPTGSASSRRSSSTCGSSPLLMRGDVVDRLAYGLDFLRVLVRDLDPELILQLHDELDQVERVGVEILLERGFLGDLALLDSELLGQDVLDPLEDFLPRRGHVTSQFRLTSAPTLPAGKRAPQAVPRHRAPPRGPRGGSHSRSRAATSCRARSRRGRGGRADRRRRRCPDRACGAADSPRAGSGGRRACRAAWP